MALRASAAASIVQVRPGPPAGQGEQADDQRQQQDVADRIGQRGRDPQRVAGHADADRVVEHGADDRRDGQRAHDRVDPQAGVELADVAAHEQASAAYAHG
jgi:hypothetical protein